jgi:hypothetical protein
LLPDYIWGSFPMEDNGRAAHRRLKTTYAAAFA